MPLNISYKYLQHYSLKPPWVQYLGIFFKPMHDKVYKNIYLKKIIVEEVIKRIPPSVHLFNHNFSPAFDCFVPFCWNGFLVKPFQTYCLSMNETLDHIYSNFSKSVTNRIARAEKRGLFVVENSDISPLVKMMSERKINTSAAGAKFKKLWNYLSSLDACFNIYITDPAKETIYCGGAFIIEKERVIFKASALNYEYKNTGASDLLIWHAIQKVKGMNNIKVFDFAGSMIKNIDNYFRTFGASPVVYYNISKNKLPFIYKIGLKIKGK